MHDLPQLEGQALEALTDLLMIGVDHRTAPIEVRERLAYGDAEGDELQLALCDDASIAETFLISTCNRTELYLRADDERAAYRAALERAFLARAPEIELEGRCYVKRGREAARHLFAVASGLESMVLGEPEILGQVRQAAVRAEALGVSGPMLGRLLGQAIAAGRRARRESDVGAGAVSFGYAVIELAQTIFRRLERRSVLLLGAGETARLVARSLTERGVRRLTVANRGSERLDQMCELFPQTRTLPFERRYDGVVEADVVVATTAAPEPVLRRAELERAMAARRGQPLLLVDLGLPRNVEPQAARIENLFLEDVDALERLIARNLERRRAEVPRVQEIVEQELQRFVTWYRGLAVEPLVAELQRRAEALRQRELETARRHIPAEHHEHLDRLTRALVRKLLHHPSQRLRRDAGDRLRHAELVRELFGLEPEDGEES